MLGIHSKTWDIFCAVVDNFGDIGVCWRLSRQLVSEHQLKLRLWVDDLCSFQRICPEINPSLPRQTIQDIEIRLWNAEQINAPDLQSADIVIEAFACTLPENYLAAMAAAPSPPIWINLEYLSAETWIKDCHALSSPHPHLPLIKHFFFPGFTPETGGLLRETRLLQQRQHWQTNLENAWQQLGIAAPASDEITLSLFCYENPVLPHLLNIWRDGPQKIRCLIPEGLARQQIDHWLQQNGYPTSLRTHTSHQIGNLKLFGLPFVPQEHYDYLLWSCDINFVRGEDSFVRAQWAAKPFIWHIYPQTECTHHDKLAAFLDYYCQTLTPEESATIINLWQFWNGIKPIDIKRLSTYWQQLTQQQARLLKHAEYWQHVHAKQEDLATRLLRFCEKTAIIAD